MLSHKTERLDSYLVLHQSRQIHYVESTLWLAQQTNPDLELCMDSLIFSVLIGLAWGKTD